MIQLWRNQKVFAVMAGFKGMESGSVERKLPRFALYFVKKNAKKTYINFDQK